MSAESLLANPALFSQVPAAQQPWAACPAASGTHLLEHYLDLCDQYPVHARMVRSAPCGCCINTVKDLPSSPVLDVAAA